MSEGVVFVILMGFYGVTLVTGFLLRRLRPSRDGRVKGGPGIREKFAVFFLFQLALMSFAFWWPSVLGIFLVLLLALSAREVHALRSHPASLLAWGLIFLFAVSVFLMVRVATTERHFLALTFLLVAVFDGYSQISGEVLGGRKLVPRLSPGKTWSGLAGGLWFVAVVSVIAHILLFPAKSLLEAAVFGMGVGLTALAGDLSASFVKRSMGIKDFSNILGPQGGILDRADSLIWLGPALWAGHIFFR